MYFFQTWRNVFYFLGFLILTSPIAAQNPDSIRLLDQSTQLPIADAVFFYGTQSGISGSDGIISFYFEKQGVMRIAHLVYGEWELSAEMLRNAIKLGISYRESTTVDLYPVTILAVRSNLQQPGILSFDTRDKMAHDGGALLNQTPSISAIRKSGNYGFDPVLRGFKYNQLNIVLNGAQCATAACPNRMDPPTSQMAPNMLDRVEILKGPHSLRHGTSFGGTINFIPAPMRFFEHSNIYGRVSSGYESNGAIIRGEGMLGFSGSWYDTGIFASWSQGNDYESGDGTKIPSDFRRSSFGTNLGLKFGSRHQLRLSATRNLAKDTDFAALPMDLRSDDTWLLNAKHEMVVNKGALESWNSTLFASFVDHLMDNLLKPLNPRMVNTSNDAKTYNWGGRTEGIWNLYQGNVYAGFDFRAEGAEGTRIREFIAGPNKGKVFYDNAWQEGYIMKSSAFAEWSRWKGKMKYVLAGRVELNQSGINDPSSEFSKVYGETNDVQLNPSISGGAVYKINDQNSLGVWVGRSQISGNLTERFINYFPVGQDPYEMLGNPQLKPQANNQADVSYHLKTDRIIVDVSLFAAYLQDFISGVIDKSLTPRLSTSPGVRRFVNLEKALQAGFEISLKQELLKGLNHSLDMAYTYGQNLSNKKPLPEIAPLDLRYTLNGIFKKAKLEPELCVRYVMEQNRISEDFGEKSTPSFILMDAKITWQVLTKMELVAGVQNIFDKNYYEHLSRYMSGSVNPLFAPGRSFFVSAYYAF